MRMLPFLLWVLVTTATPLPGQSLLEAQGGKAGPTPKPIRFEASTTEVLEEGFLERPDKEKQSEVLRRQYESTVSLLEQEKAKEERRKKVSEQGAAFSKEFLRLRITAQDFAENFRALLEKYPLAHEDPFSRRLIERGMRISGAGPREEVVEEPEEQIEISTTLQMGIAVEKGLGIDLESHDEYQHLRDRLRSIDQNP